MTNEQIIEKMVESKKGSYVKLCKVKDLGNGVIKKSDMVIRLGIDYYNIKENKDKPHNGLKYGHYVEGLEGYVIEHKGNYYLRVYDNGTNITSKSKYYINNREVSKDEVLRLVDSNKLASNKSSCYNIKFENIVSIGR